MMIVRAQGFEESHPWLHYVIRNVMCNGFDRFAVGVDYDMGGLFVCGRAERHQVFYSGTEGSVCMEHRSAGRFAFKMADKGVN